MIAQLRRPSGRRNYELVVLATYLAGGKTAYTDTEDVAVKANKIAPGRFTWRKYKEQINIDTVRKRAYPISSRFVRVTPPKLMFFLCRESDDMTALLAAKGQQLWLRPEAGLPAIQFHGSPAQFAAGWCKASFHSIPLRSCGRLLSFVCECRSTSCIDQDRCRRFGNRSVGGRHQHPSAPRMDADGRSIQATGISPDIEVLQEVPDEIKPSTDTSGEASLRGHLKAEGEERTDSQSFIPPIRRTTRHSIQRSISFAGPRRTRSTHPTLPVPTWRRLKPTGLPS